MNQKNLFDFTSDLDVAVGPSGIAPELHREIIERRTSLAARLTSGACKNMESYAEAVGGLRAIDFILSWPERKRQALEAELGTPIDSEDT